LKYKKADNTARSSRLITLLVLAIAALGNGGAWALDLKVDHWRFQTSLYSYHFDPSPEHVENRKLVNFEAWRADDWHAGLAFFDNSFGQPSQYVYVGKSWDLDEGERFYFRLTGGLLNGYDEPYENKIPLNGLGVAPAIVPALGFRHEWFFMEAQLGGLAVIMFTAGVSWGGEKSSE
jgi:hypothetical protein